MDPSDLSLTNIIKLDRAKLLRVLEIRNQEGVRMNMYTNHLIGQDEHLNWANQLKTDDSNIVYAAIVEDEVVGTIAFNSIDPEHARADWAFYIDEAQQGRGLGGALERRALKLAFEEMGLQKLNCEVLRFNEAVILMHKRFGFVQEGIRRRHIVRDGEAIDTVLLGITREEWMASQDREDGSLSPSDIIDQIQAIRARNNGNWMDLLRLAFELNPQRASSIVASIYSDDAEIGALAEKLTKLS